MKNFNAMRIRLGILVLAFAAMLGVLAPTTAHANTTFHLWGEAGGAPSHQFTEDGITLTATASATDYVGASHSADVYQASSWYHDAYGLGVEHYVRDGSKSIDTDGWNDTLWLTFSESVELESAKFTWIDPYEEVRFVDADGEKLVDVNPVQNYDGYAWQELDFADLTGTTFGLTGAYKCSGFWLKKLSVTSTGHGATPVPTPGAAGAGLALLGLVALQRRRRPHA